MASPRKELLGYADPMRAHPGDSIDIKVTSEAAYRASIVRLVHGDESADGPGFKVEQVDSPVNGTYPGRHQDTYIGSYVEVPADGPLDTADGFTLQTWIQPTTPAIDRVQAVAGRWREGRGYGLVVDGAGNLVLRTGDGSGAATLITAGVPLVAGQWYFIAATYDPASGAATVMQRVAAGWPNPTAESSVSGTAVSPDTRGLPFLIAAGFLEDVDVPAPAECFNGKIEGPRLFDRPLTAAEIDELAAGAAPESMPGLVAAWDFSATAPSSSVAADVAGAGLNGTIVNYPMRGLTGHSWDATALSRREAPGQYGAIHFHDDDFEDSRWETDFSFDIPEDLRSGFYAAHLVTDEEEDYVTFFVTPRPGSARAPVAYLAPTLTYLAYANERLITSSGLDFSGLTNIPIVVNDYDIYLGEHREMGGSIYDIHTDGSGVAYSTTKRPIVSMRPTHRHWVTGAPRHLPFDLCLVDWLEEKEYDYDVITDEDIHFYGKELLDQYKVVMTGSHPEYWTTPMLDALEGYLADKGRFMYLGGNGFYWVTAIDPERPHVVEVRRGFAGSRAWQSHPGELELASTGEVGGIWRHVGRPPNAIVGVGFSAQGWDLKTPGYRRTEESNDPRARFIFEGIGADEEIGEFGLVMNGAAGDELDRADVSLGTPAHALVVATSAGMHSDYYLVCHEDMFVMGKEIHGTDNPNVRADIVYFETGEEGAVFSVGSINWLGSLSHNGYDNNVSRITSNVLTEFLER